MMSAQFKNKVIAVTGGGRGIGFATARLLASRGASLSIVDIQRDILVEAERSISTEFPSTNVETYCLDVRDPNQVSAWINQTVSHFGRLDGAANIAGIVPLSIGSDAGLVENIDLEEWKRTIDVNLTGIMLCMKYQLATMQEGSSVVNASSLAGLTGGERNGIYAASKHGVIGLTRSAAKEVGQRGVRVNAICPGPIQTTMLRMADEAAKAAGFHSDFDKAALTEIALRRKGEPEEVAKLVAFLLSDESSYITGNAVSIDGGWNC